MFVIRKYIIWNAVNYQNTLCLCIDEFPEMLCISLAINKPEREHEHNNKKILAFHLYFICIYDGEERKRKIDYRCTNCFDWHLWYLTCYIVHDNCILFSSTVWHFIRKNSIQIIIIFSQPMLWMRNVCVLCLCASLEIQITRNE